MGLDKFLKAAKKIQEEHKQRRSPEESKHAEGGHDESNWLVSYADMMTLLCGFFVLLFSMATLDKEKYEKMKESVSKQFHGEYVNKPEEMARFLTQVIQQAGVEKQVLIKPDPSGVEVVFESTLFFDTLNSDVRPEGKIVLNKLIESIATFQRKETKEYRIVVEGHTDSRPVVGGPFPSNWELSGARAARVVRMFIDRGFPSRKLTAIGYADTHPQVEGGRTPAGNWDESVLSKNRRVVVRILEPKTEGVPTPDGGVIPVPGASSAKTQGASKEQGVTQPPAAKPTEPAKPTEQAKPAPIRAPATEGVPAAPLNSPPSVN